MFLFGRCRLSLGVVWLLQWHIAPMVALSSKLPDKPNHYASRSTASPEETSQFSAGSEKRKERLHNALLDLGIDPIRIESSPDFYGSAAVRAYSSFILPKSAGALAVADSPTRASVVANNISFYMREHKSHQEEWLRNHDRSLAETQSTPRQPLYILLDNVRSAANVGNILRAAETARVTQVILCGITPGPPNKKVMKTAVGAAEYVPFEQAPSALEAVRSLQSRGVSVFGVETTSKSTPMWETDFPAPLALVFGNELVGVHADVLQECDGLVCIPTNGVKNSLNVATCASIVVWEALRQWQVKDKRRE